MPSKYDQFFYHKLGTFRYLRLAKKVQKALPEPLKAITMNIAESSSKGAQYRKWGLWRDDLISDEHPVTQAALKRIPKEQLHARYQRYTIALHQSLKRVAFEPGQDYYTEPEDEKPYLLPFIEQVLSEESEKKKYDDGVFERQ